MISNKMLLLHDYFDFMKGNANGLKLYIFFPSVPE